MCVCQKRERKREGTKVLYICVRELSAHLRKDKEEKKEGGGKCRRAREGEKETERKRERERKGEQERGRKIERD